MDEHGQKGTRKGKGMGMGRGRGMATRKGNRLTGSSSSSSFQTIHSDSF